MVSMVVDTGALAKEIAHEIIAQMNSKPIEKMPEALPGPELYSMLCARLRHLGYDHAHFARKLRENYGLNMSKATMSIRMTGKRPWLITEMYAAMDLLMLPHEHLHLYFPKSGKSLKGVRTA